MPNLTIAGQEFPTRVRRGVIFRAGDYGEKGKYTEADLVGMSGANPLPVNLEHRPSLLNGKLGMLTRRWVEKDEAGEAALFGEWQEPEPLALLLGDTKRQVSIELDKATKQAVGLALTWNPHIKDAAMFTKAVDEAFVKFSAGETVESVDLATFAYESTTERDAIESADFADPDNQLFPVRTQEELRQSMKEIWNASDPKKVMDRILQIAATKGLSATPDFYPMYSGPGVSAPLNEKPVESPYPYYYSSEETQHMKVFIPNASGSAVGTVEQVVAFCGGVIGPDTRGLQIQSDDGRMSRATPEQIVAFTGGQVKFAAPDAPVSPEIQAQLDRLAKFEAEEKDAGAKVIGAKAQAQYEALLKENKALPAQQEEIVAAFTVALRYDAEREGLAYFSADAPAAKFSMGDYIQKLHEARKPHTLTEEKTAGFSGDAYAIFDAPVTVAADPNDGKTKPITEVINATTKGAFARPDGK